MITKSNQRKFPSFLLILFFCSGAGALIFETLWQRMMILVFGASAPATTAILTAFFFGIAFGSLWGGKLLDRFKSTLLFYGYVEVWIAVCGLLVPALLAGVDVLYVALFRVLEPDLVTSGLYRFIMSVLVVLPAALGMGATIPIMNRLLAEYGQGVGRSVATAYGVNTLGAVLGCLTTGFVLIRVLGMQNTLFVAAGLNALVALCVLLTINTRGLALLRRLVAPPRDAVMAAAEGLRSTLKEGSKIIESIRHPNGLVAIYFLTGFLALGYEVTWIRILNIYSTSSVMTFTLALTIYLLGFSLGSLWLYRLLLRRIRALAIFALANWGVGFFSLLAIPLIYAFPTIISARSIARLVYHGRLTMTHVVGWESLCAVLLMFIPTVFMGMAYPALCQVLIGEPEATGKKSGKYYFLGTLGAAFGVVMIGIVAIPALGLVGTLGFLFVSSLILSFFTFIMETGVYIRRLNKIQITSLVLICAAAVFGFRGPPFTKSGFLVRKGVCWEEKTPLGSVYRSLILRYQAGTTGTVSVREVQVRPGSPPQRSISVDEQVVAATTAEAKVDAKMLAHLPLLLHPDPKRALTVGFGSGGTSWSMTRYDIEVECVEIEPEVSRSAELFLMQNYNVLKEPNFRLILNDARDHLHVTPERYDVISTDVTNLQYKQNGNLYTREYFALMKERLREDGIACAWVPMTGISPREFRILVRTFLEVYPHTSLWLMNHTTTYFGILIGTPGPLEIDLQRIEEGFADPAIRADLAEIDVTHPFQFVHFLHLDEDAARRYAGDVPLHTDDRPILEFSSPLTSFQTFETFPVNLRETLSFRPAQFTSYVIHLREEDKALFEEYRRASELGSEMILCYELRRTRQTDRERIANLKKGLNLAEEISRLTPKYRMVDRLRTYFETTLNRIQGPVR